MPKVITREVKENIISEYGELSETMKPASARGILVKKYDVGDTYVSKLLKRAGFTMYRSFPDRNKNIMQDFHELNEKKDCMEVVKQLAGKYNLTVNMIFTLIKNEPQYRVCKCGERFPKPPSHGAPPARCPICLAKKSTARKQRHRKQSQSGCYSSAEIKKSIMYLGNVPNGSEIPHYSQVRIETRKGIAQIVL